jgi:hypothetical protein
VRSRFGLPGLSQRGLTQGAGRKQSGFLAQALRLLGQSHFKILGLLETASLHCVAPFRERKAGAQPGDLITDRGQVPRGDISTMDQIAGAFRII